MPSGISSTGQGGGSGEACGQEMSDRDSVGGGGVGKGQLPQPGKAACITKTAYRRE